MAVAAEAWPIVALLRRCADLQPERDQSFDHPNLQVQISHLQAITNA
jgi:hypothetical protein